MEPGLPLGRITISKMMNPDGGIYVDAQYEDLNIFEAIGMLLAEADTQRAGLRDRYRPDE